jgi:adenylate cyclase
MGLQADKTGERSLDVSSHQFEERRLAVVMFTDIAGYTAITQTNESRALRILDEHNRLLRSVFAGYEAEEIKTMGDSFLLVFKSALNAVRCAERMQRSVAERNALCSAAERFNIRIGIHLGDVVKKGGDVFGDTVNLTSRIERLAGPGETVVSSQVYEHIKANIEFSATSLGEHRLKNVDSPVLVYRVSSGSSRAAPMDRRSGKARMAILPFAVIGGTMDDEYLSEGFTEELISAFLGLRRLKVVAKSTAMRYKAAEKSASEIGRELNVDTVLQGSIRKLENRLRVTVQLVDVVTEEYLWSQTYDGNLGDVLDVQRDIAKKSLVALRKVTGQEPDVGGIHKKATGNTDAYLLYLKGRYHLTRHTESEVKSAIEYFARAVELDHNFASAYAMQAQCYMFLGFFGFISPHEGFERAEPLLRRAIELDDDLDVAHMLLGRLLMDRDWDWVGSEVEMRRAVEISPNSAEAHYRYGLLLHDLGRDDEALAEVTKSVELDPLSVATNQVAGTVCYFLGKSYDAIRLFQTALEIEPRAALAHNNMGLAYVDVGRVEEGIEEVRKAVELDPKNVMFKTDLCYVYFQTGRVSEAKEILATTENGAATTRVPPIAIAGMYAIIGESSNALEWLWKAYAEHSPYLASLKVERWFDGIRDHPSFLELMRKVGLL